MNSGRRLILFLATGFGVGYARWAPGTLGTLVGLPLCYGLTRLPLSVALAGILIFIFFAIWIAEAAERELGRKDPGCIVIDEMAGLMVTMVGLPWNVTTIVGGFLLFRLFDIVKPFPIRQLERRFKGGIGIVIDDVMAGIIASITLRIILKLFDKII